MGLKSIRIGLHNNSSLFKNTKFVAMDPLKLYNTINTGRNVGVFIIDFIPIDFSPITKKELLWPL